MQTHDLAQHVKWLKGAFPLAHRVYVREVPRAEILDKSDGTCTWTGKSFVILVASGQALATKIDVLNHEWAHARVKHVPDAKDEPAHNPLWSAEYGRIAAAYEAYKGNP